MGTILIIAAVIGLVPAAIARDKGRSFFAWWIYGTLLFIVALIHALLMKPTEEAQLKFGDAKKCPYCAELVKPEAKVCRYCGRELQ